MKKILLSYMMVVMGLNAGVLNKEGKYFISWGWNMSEYTKTDIQFRGDNYSYTISDVSASDRQTNFGWVYLREQTIPQYNLKIGYFFNDRESIIFGVDHMKYVMDSPQRVNIDGKAHNGTTYNNGTIDVAGFLAFEHTDGLNYINIAYNYFIPLWEDSTQRHALSLFVGGGAGVMVPRSNVTLIGYEARNDKFRLAGYGIDVQGGFHLDLYEDFFMRGELKGGFIDMLDVATTDKSSDRAMHEFGFFEYSISFGYSF
ncbi:MAG: hypothetical protein QM493_00395 [Sulfurovum sp.]